ncbi:MAG: BlaI/MecI/CopY family transcriptional regulator [Gemmataceae bacterium]|nr:BlaI/MecI/CopY family transcriptional regulator [Gemmataceae bacterium]
MAPNYDATNAEIAVLHQLWQRGPMTVRQLADLLYPGGEASQYATVQTLLARLEEKQCVSSDRSARPHRFTATARREELIGWQLRSTAEKLCNGSMTPLLLHLLQAGQFDDAERAELRSFLDRLKKSKPGE